MSEKLFNCLECGKNFLHNGHLNRHKLTHSNQKPYQCPMCNKQFKYIDSLSRHKSSHSSEKLCVCSECNKPFKDESSLALHMHAHSKEKLHQCLECNKYFLNSGHLNRHKLTHSNQKPHECPVCHKNFKYATSLSRHKLLHSTIKSHQCSQCGKRFIEETSLALHIQAHSGEKSHQCLECGKYFTYKSSLVKHKLLHEGLRRYQCPECGKQFMQNTHFEQHLLIHSDEKRYECLDCGKKFKQHASLSQHKLIHSGEKRYECLQCGKRFTKQSNLAQHKIFHSVDKRHECLECGKKFSLNSMLLRHKLIHSGEKKHECLECGKRFASHSNLAQHKLVHSGEKKHECSVCEKRFKYKYHLTRHILIHWDKQNGVSEKRETLIAPDTKIYQCEKCSTKFYSQSGFAQHVLGHMEKKVGKDGENSLSMEEEVESIIDEEKEETENVSDDFTENGEFLDDLRLKQEILESLEIEVEKEDVKIEMIPHDENVEKLKSQEVFVKHQLSMFDTIVKRTYPVYNEPTEFDLCKLDISAQILSNEQHKNFWKLTCQQISKEDTNLHFLEENKIMWKLQNYETNQLCPSFVSDIIKVFEEFVKTLPNQAKNFSYESKNQMENIILMDITMQSNSEKEIMVVITVEHDNPVLKIELKNYLHSQPDDSWNLKSVFYKTNKSKAELLYGMKEFYITIGNLEIEMSANVEFTINEHYIKTLIKIIEDYLKPCIETTLLEIGCGNGLIGLLLASKCKEVIGLDCSSVIEKAEKICESNNINNVSFEKDEIKNLDTLFEGLQNCKNVIAIVNHSVNCGLSVTMMKYLHKLKALNCLVVLTPFTEPCFPSLLRLMKPSKNHPFIPLCSSIFYENYLNIAMLMKRKEMSLHQMTIKQESNEDIFFQKVSPVEFLENENLL